jgi:hypothetical protein
MSEVAMFFQQAWHKTKWSVAYPAAKHGTSMGWHQFLSKNTEGPLLSGGGGVI